ncbi:MAG TPA: hypothetical protein V6C84_30300 [Coleofasciculaceae cyanobacterium]|jgi:bacteriocin-like protein
MSTKSNKEIKPQVERLSDEDLETISGGAVVLGTGGIEVSFTPSRHRLLPIE